MRAVDGKQEINLEWPYSVSDGEANNPDARAHYAMLKIFRQRYSREVCWNETDARALN